MPPAPAPPPDASTPGPSAAGPDEPRQRRRDAVRNRERVIAAASEIFGEHGLDAPIPEIARRAGVGKGTVYRNFPTKEHLAAAVAVDRLRGFQAVLEQAPQDPADPLGSFRTLMLAAAEHLSRDCVLGQAVDVVADDPQVLESQRRIQAIVSRTLTAAQSAGAIRPDISGDDIMVLVLGVGRVIPPVGHGGRTDLWRRYMLLAFDALRPDGSSLPTGFADDTEARTTLRAARSLHRR